MKKPIIILAIITVIAVVAYFLLKRRPNNSSEEETGDLQQRPLVPNNTSKPANNVSEFPLKRGSINAKVKLLQMALNRYVVNPVDGLKLPIEEDSIFGEDTETLLNAVTKKKTVNSMLDLTRIITGSI